MIGGRKIRRKSSQSKMRKRKTKKRRKKRRRKSRKKRRRKQMNGGNGEVKEIPLPAGWKEHWSRRLGRPYYFHAATGRSVWERWEIMDVDEGDITPEDAATALEEHRRAAHERYSRIIQQNAMIRGEMERHGRGQAPGESIARYAMRMAAERARRRREGGGN